MTADPVHADAHQVRYRSISIHQALATPRARERAMELLDAIARDLARS